MMRRARITYPGAYHHAMNRGFEGRAIFSDNRNKTHFLDLLSNKSKKLKIKILAYCVMDSHYHLVIENSSGRMSDFFKQLNGEYGMYYRKIAGGKGYVFQDRYKSILIEKDSYLIDVIIYVLQNPLRAKIVKSAGKYNWSSMNEYFSSKESGIVDAELVSELFGSKEELFTLVESRRLEELPVRNTRRGHILGGREFEEKSVERFDRRENRQSGGMLREDDRYFEPIDKVIWEFERSKGIKIEDIKIDTHQGKRRRGDLLMLLKERAGLRYSQISEFDIFSDLRFDSLRGIYRNMRKKKMEKEQQ